MLESGRELIMRISKRQLISSLIIIVVTFFMATYQLPYYIYKPGNADDLTPIVEVAGGYESEGEMHLVTVSGLQATPLQFIVAKLTKYNEVLPLEEVRPAGISDEDYMHAQLQMMENSQESSVVVAYEEARKEIEIEYSGVYVVSVVDGMPAYDILKMGDRITGIDDQVIKEASDLIKYIETKQAEDIVSLNIERDESILTEKVTLKEFKDTKGKVGLGIELVTDRSVKVDPEVTFSSGKIGGPSAGLMFALEIYDQLTEKDITKGLQVIGTGTLDYDGKVGRIGGIDKKVIAADKAGGDIFFAPFEDGAEDSNYEVAKKTAEDIKSDMKIVPVDTFEEALLFLEGLK